MSVYAVFGDPAYKFGDTTRLFGVPTPTWVGRKYVIEVDWDGDGLYNGDNEAIHAVGLRTERGFDDLYNVNSEGHYSGLAPVEPGIAIITLDNTTKRFSAWNTSGALFGNLYPGKMIKIYTRKDYTGTDKYIFTGIIDDIKEDRQNKTVEIICKDGVEILQSAETSVAFQVPVIGVPEYTMDTFVSALLSSIDWRYSYDVSKFQYSAAAIFYAVSNRRAFVELQEVAKADAGGDGIFYINAQGNIVFDMLWDYLITPTTYTADVFSKDVTISQPWKNVVQSIRADVYRWGDKSTAVLWSFTHPVLRLAAGQTSDVWGEYTYNDIGTFMVADAITPVSATDFIANASEDGTGADLTANISVVFTNFGQNGKITITNSGATDAFLTTLQIRGTPYVVTKSFDNRATQTDGIYTTTNKRIIAGSIWHQIDTNMPFSETSFAFDFLGYAKFSKVVDVELRARDEQFDREINDLVTFDIADPDLQEYTHGLSTIYSEKGNHFRLMKITHKWLNNNGQDVLTTWKFRHILVY